MNWPVSVAEAVRDRYSKQVADPDWHGGARAAQEIADLLRRCATLPTLTPTQLCVLDLLRTTRCATQQDVLLKEFRSGAASISWHNGTEFKRVTVLPSTLKRLRDLGLLACRAEQGDTKWYGLSVTGELVSRFYAQ